MLGILGGMGPAASAEFYRRLVELTPATCDQEHIPCIIWGDPTVPDRSTSLINHDDLPWPKLKQGILGLKAAGCTQIAIPCNTAHFWYDRMLELGVPIKHIADTVAEELQSRDITSGTIGVIGTKATIELGLYQTHLEKLGYDCVTPSAQDMETLVQPAINLVKANNLTDAHQLLMQVIDNLYLQGVDAVVLGCTELPLAVKENTFKGRPLINSIDSLATSIINVMLQPTLF